MRLHRPWRSCCPGTARLAVAASGRRSTARSNSCPPARLAQRDREHSRQEGEGEPAASRKMQGHPRLSGRPRPHQGLDTEADTDSREMGDHLPTCGITLVTGVSSGTNPASVTSRPRGVQQAARQRDSATAVPGMRPEMVRPNPAMQGGPADLVPAADKDAMPRLSSRMLVHCVQRR